VLCKGYVSKHGYAYDVLKVEVAFLETLLPDLFFVLIPQQERLRFIVIQVVDLPGGAERISERTQRRTESRAGTA
jgi:hypothetical protein